MLEMWQSLEVQNLAAAIVKAQMALKPALKDCTNPFFKSKYADLSSVWAALTPFSDNGIAITQSPMDSESGHVVLDTQLTHTSGQWMRSRLTMPVAKGDPQGMGSALTYARRYALGCMTGLVTEEDDDGNAAQRSMAQRPVQQPAKPVFAPQPKPAPALIQPITQDASAPVIIWNAGTPPPKGHRGKDIRDVPEEYLTWYLKNGPQQEFIDRASEEIERRHAAQLFHEDAE